MSVIPVIVQNKKCLSYFKKANAVGPENAQTLSELGIKKNMPFKRLMKLNAIAEIDGKFYVPVEFSETLRFKNV